MKEWPNLKKALGLLISMCVVEDCAVHLYRAKLLGAPTNSTAMTKCQVLSHILGAL